MKHELEQFHDTIDVEPDLDLIYLNGLLNLLRSIENKVPFRKNVAGSLKGVSSYRK